jgi:hypothetical protein
LNHRFKSAVLNLQPTPYANFGCTF